MNDAPTLQPAGPLLHYQSSQDAAEPDVSRAMLWGGVACGALGVTNSACFFLLWLTFGNVVQGGFWAAAVYIASAIGYVALSITSITFIVGRVGRRGARTWLWGAVGCLGLAQLPWLILASIGQLGTSGQAATVWHVLELTTIAAYLLLWPMAMAWHVGSGSVTRRDLVNIVSALAIIFTVHHCLPLRHLWPHIVEGLVGWTKDADEVWSVVLLGAAPATAVLAAISLRQRALWRTVATLGLAGLLAPAVIQDVLMFLRLRNYGTPWSKPLVRGLWFSGSVADHVTTCIPLIVLAAVAWRRRSGESET